jgi:hypothetical protein
MSGEPDILIELMFEPVNHSLCGDRASAVCLIERDVCEAILYFLPR